MKFATSIVALGLAAQALATPTLVERKATAVKRDIDTFQSVLSGIQDVVGTFDTDVKAYSGGDTSKLISDSDDIISTTNKGVSTLSSQPTLSETDALGLTSPVQDLTKKIQTAINDLIDKKSQLVAAGGGATVESGLQDQYDAAKKLSSTITSKVPSELSGIAASLAAGITDAIQKGIDAFKGTGGSTTTGGNTATATATATGSATTAPGTTTAPAPGSTATGTATAPGGASGTQSVPASTGSGSAIPTNPGAATSSGLVPGSSATGSSTPPLFTNAATVNKVNAAGVLAGVAALLAL
ncbi:hypothetical protein PISL3812_08676 [Talaromyces islandicus]|uniref:Cell wall mannoprotein 1 n=1 Tax=Talaromyces islandicus TaxID=28573 RepID=A0A0U1M9N2_TALIS|nr:hypothetical protein PISL3812_08676 [Talaromyces islandicus]